MAKKKRTEVEYDYIWKFNERDIKPCPCCGSDVVIVEETIPGDRGGVVSYSAYRDRPTLRFYFIRCQECGIRTDVYSTEVGITKSGEPFIASNGLKKAMDSWNCRVSDILKKHKED